MGIATAKWTRDWLGEGWRFASDRTNRLLLATYGVQRIVTLEQDGEELGNVMFDRCSPSRDRRSIRTTDANFLLVDLRLQRGSPLFGFYFYPGEDRGAAPISRRSASISSSSTSFASGAEFTTTATKSSTTSGTCSKAEPPNTLSSCIRQTQSSTPVRGGKNLQGGRPGRLRRRDCRGRLWRRTATRERCAASVDEDRRAAQRPDADSTAALWSIEDGGVLRHVAK